MDAEAKTNWVTQTAFEPSLLVVGPKTDSGSYSLVRDSGHFTLNMLGKSQQGGGIRLLQAR